MVGCFVVNKSRIIPWKEWIAAEVLLVQKTTGPRLPWLSHPKGKTMQCSHRVGMGKKWGGAVMIWFRGSGTQLHILHGTRATERAQHENTQSLYFLQTSVKMLNPVGCQVCNRQSLKKSAWSLRGSGGVLSHNTHTKVLTKAKRSHRDRNTRFGAKKRDGTGHKIQICSQIKVTMFRAKSRHRHWIYFQNMDVFGSRVKILPSI